MAKHKYRFDPDKLTFEKYRRSALDWLLRLAGVLSAIIVGTLGVYIIISTFFETPKEKILKRELENYQNNYNALNERLDNIEKVAADLEYRDESIYRTIFEAEPIPQSIRDAGYGGVEKYLKLEGYSNSKLVIESTKRTDRLAKKLYVLSKSYDEIAKLAERKEEMLASIPAIQPVKISKRTAISSGFGWRVHPIYKVAKFHEGFDFNGRIGTPIYATGDGVVIEAEYNRSGYGNNVVISHGFGYKTLYAHMDKFMVRRGQKIKRGEQIGTMGNTGLSTGPHVHYEVILNGTKLNPVFFFHNDLTPEEYQKVLTLAEQANQTLD